MTLPVEEQSVTVGMRLCMVCVWRMMGESMDRAMRELEAGPPPER